VVVAGASMRPTLEPGDWLLVRWTRRVAPGDLVVVCRPDRPRLVVVKRAVRHLERGWWVAGDDPAASDDSRTFGVVPPGLVLGRVLVRYWPVSRGLRPGPPPGPRGTTPRDR
jgi:nickel-type superoxide dismutase maturation protease